MILLVVSTSRLNKSAGITAVFATWIVFLALWVIYLLAYFLGSSPCCESEPNHRACCDVNHGTSLESLGNVIMSHHSIMSASTVKPVKEPPHSFTVIVYWQLHRCLQDHVHFFLALIH